MTDATTDELFLEQIACGPDAELRVRIGSRGTREVALVDPAWDVEGSWTTCASRASSRSPRWSRTTTPTTSAAA